MGSNSTATARRWRSVAVLVFVAAAVFVYGLALLPIETTIGKFLYEDLYYYLRIAQNVIEGRGVTFDGVEPTNGFHPLWLAVSVLVESVFSTEYATHMLLVVAASLHLLQGYLLMRIVQMSAPAPVTVLVTALFLFNYRVIAVNLCGLETPLAGCLFLASILYLYTRFVRSSKAPALQAFFVLGLLLGVGTLARFDLGLFAVFATLVALVTAFVGEGREFPGVAVATGQTVLRGAMTLGAFMVCLLPWFVWSMRHVGVLLPQSREAVVLLADPTTALKTKVFSAIWWLTDTTNAMSLWPVVQPETLTNYVGLLSIAAFALVMVVAIWGETTVAGRVFLASLGVYVACHLAYYAFFVRAEVRYLMPFVISFYLALGFALGRVGSLSPRLQRPILALVAAVLSFNVVVSGVQAWEQNQGATRTHGGHPDLLKTARWIGDNLHEDAVVGAWNAGILGYFSERQVVNLDGVVNSAAIEVNAAKALPSYLDKRQIGYLADVEVQIEDYAARFGMPEGWRSTYEERQRNGSVLLLEKVQ